MTTPRLAAVGYLNTVPLIEGLDACAGLDIELAVPSRIAGMVVDGSVDVGLVSIVDAVATPTPLAVLGCGMIGCDGPTLTVRLFSSIPPGEISTIHADTDSKTSVVLAQLVIEKLFGHKPEVVAFDARAWTDQDSSDGPETVLLIGDKVVKAAPPPERYPHELDLGEAWKSITGMPFVYAVWACLADRVDGPAVRTAEALLDRQRRRNAARLDWLVSARAAEHGWPTDLARRYLGELLRFDLTDVHREAADLFISQAAESGLIAPHAAVGWTTTAGV